MKLKLGQIYEMNQPLQFLLKEKLPMKFAFSLAKFTKEVKTNLDMIEEARIKLVQDLGEKQKDGSIKIPDEKLGEFRQQFSDLMQEEIDIEVPCIDPESLEDIKMSTEDLMRLEMLFGS